MDLSKIEVIKTQFLNFSASNAVVGVPGSTYITTSASNLRFVPDFVTVKSIQYVDVTNTSAGLLTIAANFIADGDLLATLCIQPITNSMSMCPNAVHQYVNVNQFTFTITLTESTENPSTTAVINLGLEFVKLKRDKKGEIII